MQAVSVLLFVSQLACFIAVPVQKSETFTPNTLWNQTLPGNANGKLVNLVEGDMLFSKLGSKSFGRDNRRGNWPGGVVPYVIDRNAGYTSEEIKIIHESLNLMSRKTEGCITFVPRKSEHKNYISIENGDGCNSYVGMVGWGKQIVNIDRGGCVYKGTIVHEMMHAIGFEHEQNRPDRDQYIKINYNNIDSNLYNQFDKERGSYFNTTYDLKSIMQYNEYAFSNNGKKTIVPLNGETLIPAYDKTEAQILTPTDVEGVKQLYQCANVQGTTTKTMTTEATTAEATTAEATTAEATTAEASSDDYYYYYYDSSDETSSASSDYYYYYYYYDSSDETSSASSDYYYYYYYDSSDETSSASSDYYYYYYYYDSSE